MQDIINNMTIKEITGKYNRINLIPKINPKLNGDGGIRSLLVYRTKLKGGFATEIDSSPIVREAFKECFREPIPESADTTLNVLNPLKNFCIYRLKETSKNQDDVYPIMISSSGDWVLRNDLLEIIQVN